MVLAKAVSMLCGRKLKLTAENEMPRAQRHHIGGPTTSRTADMFKIS